MKIISFLFLSMLLIFPATLLADFKVATIDMSRILNESRESQKAKQQLDKLSAEARQKVEKQRSQLEQVEAKLRAGEIAIDSTEGQKFQRDMREFNQMVQQTEEELREEFMKSNTKVTTEALQIIERYAKQNSIDLVLDRSASPRGPVVFGAPDFDITDEVVRMMR